MGERLVPATMVAALLAFAVGAATAGAVPYRPEWWPAAIAIAVLGGIAPMIYAVNIRVVPVFARRAWRSERALRHQVGFGIAGAWVVFGGRLGGWDGAVVVGSVLALVGAGLFITNLARLFRRPPSSAPPPPLPFPEQAAVDALATRFTRLSGAYLLVGLTVGLVTSLWRPPGGRWELVWAHAMLLGFFLSMASGVCYHVLSRWTGQPWRSVTTIRLHLWAVMLGLPLMLLALAADWALLLTVAGPLQVIALALFLANIAPMMPALPGPTRPAMTAAAVALVIGVGLGGAFAVDAALGARLRLVHAGLNLFGWTGLLVCGVGYYLVPRFAGRPPRWPRLATVQLAALATGVLLGAVASAWRALGDGPAVAVVASQGLVALGFLLFGSIVAGTFAAPLRVGTVAELRLQPAMARRQARRGGLPPGCRHKE